MVEIDKLSCGSTIVVEKIKNKRVTCAIDFGCGATNDPILGMSHFLEHMIFSGNKKYTKSKIKDIFTRYCVKYNALTSLTFTRFYMSCIKRYFASTFRVFASIIGNANFLSKNVDIERGVIDEEIDRSGDVFAEVVATDARRNMFRDTLYSREICGTHESIKGITAENLTEYYKKYYTPQNAIVSFAGNITMAEAKAYCEKYLHFTSIGVQYYAPSVTCPNPDFTRHEISKGSSQAHLYLMQRACNIDDKDYYAYVVYDAIFGSFSNNLLTKILRDKHGLMYAGYSYMAAYNTALMQSIYIACNRDNVDKCISYIKKLRETFMDNVSEKLLRDVKLSLSIGFELAEDNVTEAALSNAADMRIFNRVIPVSEILDSINAVSLDDLSRIAKSMSDRNDIVISVLK